MSAIKLTYRQNRHIISVYENGDKVCCQCFQTDLEELKKLCEWVNGKYQGKSLEDSKN